MLLRLAHRILSQRLGDLPDVYQPSFERHVASLWSATQSSLQEGQPIILADNVAAYVNDLYRDPATAPTSYSQYPPSPPPFQTFFIEWNCPPGVRYPGGDKTFRDYGFIQAGAQIVASDSSTLSMEVQSVMENSIGRSRADAMLRGARWYLMCADYLCLRDGRAMPTSLIHLFLDENGKYQGVCGQNLLQYGANDQPCSGAEAVLMFTLAFMQCKNVSQIDVTKQEGPIPKWCRRQRVPELKYTALLIDPNLGHKPRSTERKTEGDRSGKALHICRGHFAHYEKATSRGLFGKGIYGTFWVPAHVRGSSDLGRVIPTYNVLSPALSPVDSL